MPLSDFLVDLIAARRTEMDDGPWVFPANSRSGHVEEPKFALAQVAEVSGVKVNVHDLRRTYVTVAESCDISYAALKALVNHAPPRDITGGYTQITVDRLREPQQRVTGRLKELIGIASSNLEGDKAAAIG